MLPGIFANTYSLERFLTPIMNKAPGSAASILPIEAAVTGGRSTWAAKRGKLLEFQEVFLEETTVAAVWLFGVRFMSKMVDKVLEHLKRKGKLHAIYSETDWSKGFMSLFASSKKSPSVFLSGAERFSNSYDNLMKIMKVKGIKFAVAVAVPLILCGFVIPRLNQFKTSWIIKRFYSNKQKPDEKKDNLSNQIALLEKLQNGLNQPFKQQFSSSAPNAAAYSWNKKSCKNILPDSVLTVPPPFAGTGTLAGYNSPYTKAAGVPTFGNSQKNFNIDATFGPLSAQKSVKPRFGLSVDKAYSWLSKLGHAVDNTHSGSVLVVDVGVTGGRMATASRRSVFESFEYGARDSGSLFFYLASVPLVMKLFDSKFGKRMIKAVTGKDVEAIIQLDSQIVSRLNQHIIRKLNSQNVNTETLRLLLEGINNRHVMDAGKSLSGKLMQAPMNEFVNIMNKELIAFAVPNSTIKTFERFIASSVKGENISANQLEQLLKGIWSKEEVLKNLTQSDRFHLNTAVKLAFHHTFGMKEKAFKEAVLSLVAEKLSKEEMQLLLKNLKNSSGLGSDKLMASMLRRSFNAANMVKSLSDESREVLVLQPDKNLVLKRVTSSPASAIESRIRLVERAVIEGTSVETFIKDKLEDVVSEYERFLKGNRAGKLIYKPLDDQIRHISRILNQNGALSSRELEELAELLEQNGRTWPKALRWLQGSGLKNLASDVRMLSPFVDGKTAVSDVMKNHVEEIFNLLVNKTAKHTNQHKLIQAYRNIAGQLLKGEGRISILLTDSMPKKLFEEQLENHIKRIMLGGLKNNERIYNRALQIVGRLPMEAEKFVSPHASHDIKKLVNPYLDVVTRRLGTYLNKSGKQALSLTDFSRKILEPFAKESIVWRRGVWGLALVVSMLGVGVLIPKLQFLMTRSLTGNNKHPGIAAALSHK